MSMLGGFGMSGVRTVAAGEGTEPPERRHRAVAARLVARLPLVFGVLALVVFAAWYWHPAYRYDEYLVAVARARLSWRDLLRVIATTDPAPLLLYVLMKPWAAV